MADTFYQTLDRSAGSAKERLENTQIAGLRVWNNFAKGVALATFVKHELPVRVLDLACGKGGDFFKVMQLFPSMGKYVGCDITPRSIDDFRARVASAKVPPEFDVFVHDLRTDVPAHLAGQFTVINIGFAFHYFFESEATLHTLFRTLSTTLMDGGRVMITTTHEDAIRARLGARTGRAEIRIHSELTTNLVCRIIVDPAIMSHGYFFELLDGPRQFAVKAVEYFVHMPTLKQMCQTYGFDIVHDEPLEAFAQRHTTHPLADHMSIKSTPLTHAEKSVLSIYRVMILEKRPAVYLQGDYVRAPWIVGAIESNAFDGVFPQLPPHPPSLHPLAPATPPRAAAASSSHRHIPMAPVAPATPPYAHHHPPMSPPHVAPASPPYAAQRPHRPMSPPSDSTMAPATPPDHDHNYMYDF